MSKLKKKAPPCGYCGRPCSGEGACELRSGVWGCSYGCYSILAEIESRRQAQRCKVCYAADSFDFKVTDAVWRRVVPGFLRNSVVCLRCFDAFAYAKGEMYTVDRIFFAGQMFCGTFNAAARDLMYRRINRRLQRAAKERQRHRRSAT